MKAAIFCISNETIKKMVALRFKKSAFIIINEYLRNNIVFFVNLSIYEAFSAYSLKTLKKTSNKRLFLRQISIYCLLFVIIPQFWECGNSLLFRWISHLSDIRNRRSFRDRLKVVHWWAAPWKPKDCQKRNTPAEEAPQGAGLRDKISRTYGERANVGTRRRRRKMDCLNERLSSVRLFP